MVPFILVIAAAAAGLAPIPEATVETRYSQGLYLSVQRVLTTASNLTPIAIFDVAVGALALAALVAFIRRWRRAGVRGAVWSGIRGAVTFAALVYLLFVALWGLNYRRVPLEDKLAYDSGRVTRDAAVRFGQRAVAQANALAAPARAGSPDGALEAAFREAQRRLGSQRFAVPGRPKRSLLGAYFRRAAIDGMTDPFFLEILVNPDVLPVERPFVLAHEWAHLAGYADESEANFVAWLTCVGSDDAAVRYSGWIAAYQYTAQGLPVEDRRALRAALAPPVVADLQAIAARLERSNPALRNAARDAYDTYLRANRVEEGIASYGAVLRLLVGTAFDQGWVPRPRTAAD